MVSEDFSLLYIFIRNMPMFLIVSAAGRNETPSSSSSLLAATISLDRTIMAPQVNSASYKIALGSPKLIFSQKLLSVLATSLERRRFSVDTTCRLPAAFSVFGA